ncbi:MAG: hypothetical protein A2Y25_05810 [Candidatus Melainabacteria bacterium GWF2_37_15]|nr:MAG: hypothetical protein A2Y25_05810 [Candidatus Melainabacteria bacterium GWF2_37_15]
MVKREIEIEKNNAKNQLKYISSMEGMSLTVLKKRINERFNKTDSVSNLYKKLDRKTIKLTEFMEIAEVLGYKLILKKED